MEIHMVENMQKGITNAYRNDKKDVDTRGNTLLSSNWCCSIGSAAAPRSSRPDEGAVRAASETERR